MEDPDVDPLFVGVTRPAMVCGVTYSYATIMTMITVITFLATKSLLSFLIAIPLYAVGYIACLYDPRIFDMVIRRIQHVPPVRTYRHWRCNTYRP